MTQLRLSPSGLLITGNNPGDALIWNGSEWIPQAVGPGSTPNLQQVLIEGNNAGGNVISGLGAPSNPDDAARLTDITPSTPQSLDQTLLVGNVGSSVPLIMQQDIQVRGPFNEPGGLFRYTTRAGSLGGGSYLESTPQGSAETGLFLIPPADVPNTGTYDAPYGGVANLGFLDLEVWFEFSVGTTPYVLKYLVLAASSEFPPGDYNDVLKPIIEPADYTVPPVVSVALSGALNSRQVTLVNSTGFTMAVQAYAKTKSGLFPRFVTPP